MKMDKKILGDKQLAEFIAEIGKPSAKDEIASVKLELAAIRKAAPAEMKTAIDAELKPVKGK